MEFNKLTQERLGEILDNIIDHKSYFAGGTLCVDDVLEDGMVLMFQLDGFIFNFRNDDEIPLNKENAEKLFKIYVDTKGETEYYKEKHAQVFG